MKRGVFAALVLMGLESAVCQAASDCDVEIVKASRVDITPDKITITAEAIVRMVVLVPRRPDGEKGRRFAGRDSTWVTIKADNATFVVRPPRGETPDESWSKMSMLAAKALKSGRPIGRVGYYRPEVTIQKNRVTAISGRAYLYLKRDASGRIITERPTNKTKKASPTRPAESKQSKLEKPSLTGRFVLDGQPPKAPLIGELYPIAPMVFPKLAETPLTDLSVGEQNGIANIFVYIRSADVPFEPKRNDGKKEREPGAEISVVEGQFSPRAQVMQSKHKLRLVNSLDRPINYHSRFVRNPDFNILIPVRAVRLWELKSEPVPVRLNCDIYPWMQSWLLICDHPYAAVTDRNGRFTITNLPQGKWEIQVWHERVGAVETTAWPKGRFTLRVSEGQYDMGTVVLPMSMFNPAR